MDNSKESTRNIENIFISLYNGQLNPNFKKIFKPKNIYVDLPVKPEGKQSFPVDILVYSRKYSHALLLEIKCTTSTDINENQVDSYSKISFTSLKNKGVSLEESTHIIDSAFSTTDGYKNCVLEQLLHKDIEWPCITLNSSTYKLEINNDSFFKSTILKKALKESTLLGISNIEEITPYIKFSSGSKNSLVAKLALLDLISLQLKFPTEQGFTVTEITKNAYSSNKIFWDTMSHSRQEEIKNKVTEVFSLLTKTEKLGKYLKRVSHKYWRVDLFDSTGTMNISKFSSLIESNQKDLDLIDSTITLGLKD